MEAQKKAARTGKRGPYGPNQRHPGGQSKYTPSSDTRLHRQRSMRLPEMLAELPRHCSIGVKTKYGGNQQYWRGYKLHLDVADGQIPISAILTAGRAARFASGDSLGHHDGAARDQFV